MLTKHQRNLSFFFDANSSGFLSFVIDYTPAKMMLTEDMFPLVVKYLDESLRKEITLYEKYTTGYFYIEDILIELHITKENSELSKTLVTKAMSVFV